MIRPRTLIPLGILLTILATMLPVSSFRALTAFAHPDNTAYYIDNSGTCADSGQNAGTQGLPYCDFNPVNGQTFGQGDKIMLKAGDSWTQTLSPLGSGASGNPIILGCYPAASCNSQTWPTIKGTNTSSDAVDLTDASYWTVNGLMLTAAKDGIHDTYSSLNHQGLLFENLYIYNLGRMGIDIDGYNGTPQYTVPTGNAIVSWVTIYGIGCNNDPNCVGFMADSSPWAGAQDGNCCNNAQQHILIQNSWATGSSGCAFWLGNLSSFTMMDSNVYGNTGCGAVLYNVEQNNATFVNDIFNGSADGSQDDNAIFNEDNHLTNVSWKGDYFRGAYGSALEWTENPCFFNCTSTTNTGAVVDSSIFSNNSQWDCGNDCNAPYTSYGFYGDIDTLESPQGTGMAQNNLYYDVPQKWNTFCRACSSPYWTLTNDDSVTSDANLYDAPYGYSGSTQNQNQWSYQGQGSGCTGWGYLTASGGTWSDGCGGSISQFDMTPPPNGIAVARVWHAPQAGNVQVRGWILKNTLGGSGVWAGIYQCSTSTWLWTSTIDDQTSISTDLNNVQVTQGDCLAFEVTNNSSGNNTDDITSWAPAIAYTAGPLTFADAGFETPVQMDSPNYTYQPSGTAWSFDSGTGIQANASAWTTGGSYAPEGMQAAFIQSSASGGNCISQTVSGFTPGNTYSFTFSAAQRGNSQGGQSIRVFMDSTSLGTFMPASTSYQDFISDKVTPGSGTSHTIKFCGTEAGGDHTAFIDDVRINVN